MVLTYPERIADLQCRRRDDSAGAVIVETRHRGKRCQIHPAISLGELAPAVLCDGQHFKDENVPGLVVEGISVRNKVVH